MFELGCLLAGVPFLLPDASHSWKLNIYFGSRLLTLATTSAAFKAENPSHLRTYNFLIFLPEIIRQWRNNWPWFKDLNDLFLRKLSVTIILAAIFSCIATIFWFQEGKYLLPTPIPRNYAPIIPAQLVRLDSTMLPNSISKPTLFHFFSPDCPCSRFNLKHFLSLNKKYKSHVDFYAVVTDEEKAVAAKEMLDDGIIILVDSNEKLAKACGVYSTPQAAILQADQTLFFRGNYNRARYCTDKNSNFVQMALDSLMASKAPPLFNELATNSYGCELSDNQPSLLIP